MYDPLETASIYIGADTSFEWLEIDTTDWKEAVTKYKEVEKRWEAVREEFEEAEKRIVEECRKWKTKMEENDGTNTTY